VAAFFLSFSFSLVPGKERDHDLFLINKANWHIVYSLIFNLHIGVGTIFRPSCNVIWLKYILNGVVMSFKKSFTLNDVERINGQLQERGPNRATALRNALKVIKQSRTVVVFDSEKMDRDGRTVLGRHLSRNAHRK